MENDLLKRYAAHRGERQGNHQRWIVVRKSDDAEAIVTVHPMSAPRRAIQQAIRSDIWKASNPEELRALLAGIKSREGEDEMAPKKTKKAAKAPKQARAKHSDPSPENGRRPVMAEYISEPLKLVAKFKGEELEAFVKGDGTIIYDGNDYTSPSVAAAIACKRKTCNGWTLWKFKNEAGELVLIDTLRGKKKKAA